MCDNRGIQFGARLQRWLARALLASLALGGCSIDSRTLELDPASSGGSSGSPVVSHHSSGSSSAPVPDVDLPVCVYDASPGDECATLVDNAGFAEDVSGWAPEGGTTRAWDPTNASGSAGSGSIVVENLLFGASNGVAPGAAIQCLPVTEGEIYDLTADVFIAEGQGAGEDEHVTYEGQALLSVYFSNLANCAPPTTGNIFSQSVSEAGKWIHLEATGRAPEAAVSMAVRLDTIKPFREFFFKARYDNVFVRER